MIPFKNLKAGFSFIEIIVALTLFAIFGSSLFLVQSNIFSKVLKTHQILFFNQDNIYHIMQLKNKIHHAVAEKQSVDTIKIKENKKNPDRSIDLKLINISDQSELKNFSSNVRIVESSVTYHDNRTIKWFSFVYIPEIAQDKQKEESKTPQAKIG
ncbi:prepilin-type N-terminal cleavage/methylation domain-containing protein [Candidatus Dependentiae bacterium]|nr:prepilin-type N-terminal cleavage/methylation domain-containing protein [Candidatus Dependentiae bacterium]